MNTFKKRLKDLRIEKGLSQNQDADLLSVHPRYVSHWEAGHRACDFDMLISIAQTFDVSVDFLLGKSDY